MNLNHDTPHTFHNKYKQTNTNKQWMQAIMDATGIPKCHSWSYKLLVERALAIRLQNMRTFLNDLKIVNLSKMTSKSHDIVYCLYKLFEMTHSAWY